MTNLIKDWLLDPAAQAFLLSVAVAVVLGAGSARRPDGRLWRSGFFVLVLVMFWLLTAAPRIVNPLVLSVEDRYAGSNSCLPAQYLVVLGGGISSQASSPDQWEFMKPATFARVSAAARLVASTPQSTLILTGGAIRQISEASMMADYVNALGISEERIWIEEQSSSTRENALRVAEMLESVQLDSPLTLVTSALHMPRAVKTFEKSLAGPGNFYMPACG